MIKNIVRTNVSQRLTDMSEFVGLTVVVTLIDPPNTKIRGLVTSIVEQQLQLSQVTWLNSNSRTETVVVEGENISEIEIETEEKPTLYPSLTEPFVDPAIVSYDRPEGTNPSRRKLPATESRPSPPIDYSSKTLAYESITATHATQSQPTISLLTELKEPGTRHNILHDFLSSATLGGPFNDLPIQDPDDIPHEEYTDPKPTTLRQEENSAPEENIQPTQPFQKAVGRRNRRGAQKGKAAIPGREISGKAQPQHLHPNRPRDPKEGKIIKEWSQTSLTVATSHLDQPPRKPASRPDAPTTKRKLRHHLRVSEDQNGWATGEASDIQDMGDFDFEGNLSKFDKRKVFEKIRQEDTTADEERLVSFNRVHARPGTNGGKNLHYSENVLDPPNSNGSLAWNRGDSDDEINESKLSSRRSSRRNVHRKKTPSRKGSAIQTGDQHLAGLVLLPDQVAKARFTSNDQAGSPKVFSNPSIALFPSANNPLKPTLRILPSNRICPSLTPLQMVELEHLATSELGLTEDMIIENAARGIAETARRLVNVQPAISGTSDQAAPVIYILAGNHRSGARAIAAGRHLRNHNTRVAVCMLAHEREADLIDSVRRQLVIYRKCGGLTSKPDELVHSLQHLQASRSVIIDALLGIHSSFDDLRTDDQTAYSQLSKWANSVEISALSIDIPSGLDASSGMPTAETDLVINADFILSLGAPKVGLLAALGRSPAFEKWGLFLTDIGINNIVWKKFGNKRTNGVEFGSEWVTGLRYKLGED